MCHGEIDRTEIDLVLGDPSTLLGTIVSTMRHALLICLRELNRIW